MRASSVLPTPDGPRKTNEPVGRLGSLRPARERRIAFEMTSIAGCWPMTRLCSSSSMRISFAVSASVSLKTGMPVHIETMSAISSSPIDGRSPPVSPASHCSSSSRFFVVSLRSLSRRFAAFSNSCASIAASFSRRVVSISCSSSRLAGRRGHRLDPHPRRGLVDQVDRLVGQEAVGDVAVGELAGGLQRVVGDRHLVVLLVAVAQAAQDLDGLLDGRLVDADLLEAPLERRVALEVLAVLVERRRADRLQLAARERRLEDRGGVDRALGGAGADEVVQLVDEQDDVAALGDLLHHLLEALLELAAVLRAGDERREVERVDLLVLQQLGHLGVGDPLGEALDDGGLADARLADQHRVVLRAPREDLHDPLDLGLAPDDRVELAVGGELGQVAAELVEQLRGLLRVGARAGRAGDGAAGAAAAAARARTACG